MYFLTLLSFFSIISFASALPQLVAAEKCDVEGQIVCNPSGATWSMCSSGRLVDMGAVAPGMVCSDGAMVARQKIAEELLQFEYRQDVFRKVTAGSHYFPGGEAVLIEGPYLNVTIVQKNAAGGNVTTMANADFACLRLCVSTLVDVYWLLF
jgi:hypothetical protein